MICQLRLLIVGVFVTVSFTLQGQFNLKVGYNLGYSQLEGIDDIIDLYNAQYPDLSTKMHQVNFHHGLEIGARHRFGNFGIDIGLSTISGTAEAEGLPSSAGLTSQEWRSTHSSYYFGLENYFGSFGYGANLGYNRLQYKSDIAGASDKKVIFSESQWASKVYFILEMPGSNVAFQLRPYVSFPLSDYNVKSLELTIDPDSVVPAENYNQDVMIYGLSFLFFNGPQN